MKKLNIFRWAAVAAVCTLPIACAQEGETTEPTEQSQQEVEKPEAPKAKKGDFKKHRKGKRHHKMGRHGKGPGKMFLHAALKDLELDDATRTKIEAIKDAKRDGKDGEKSGKHEAKKAFKAELSKQIAAGTIDASAFDDHFAKMETHMEAKKAEQAKMLNDLHAALTPELRKQLSDKVTAKMAEHAKRMEEMRAKWAEKKADKGDGAEDGKPGKGKLGKRGRRGGKFGKRMHLPLRGLELTEEQQKKIDELRAKRAENRPSKEEFEARHTEMKKKMEELIAAFAKDDFDAAKFDFRPANVGKGDKMKKHLEAMGEVVKILDEGQRKKLAERMEKPDFRGKGKRRGRKDFEKREEVAEDIGDVELDETLDELEEEILEDEAEAAE